MATSRTTPFTVALVSAGRSSDAAQWSGIPQSLSRSLTDLGVRVVALDLALPGPLQAQLNRRLALRHRVAGALAITLPRRLSRLQVDGVCQLGAEFVVRTHLPTVTYDDMTVAQLERRQDHVSSDPTVIRRWRDRQAEIYRGVTICGTFSHWAASSIVDDYKIDPGKVGVLGWGQNHAISPPASRDWTEPRYLFVGLDWDRKDGDGVVRAFKRLHRERPDARLDVVGGHPPLSEDGVTGHGRLRLDDDDERARLRSLFAQATCFVMPSLHEPAGIVYAEAAGGGVPSIGTTAGGAADLIRPDCGLIVEPNAPDALYEALLRMADPDTAASMGEAARKRARLFTWPAVGERILRALGAPHPHDREWLGYLD